jgi:signal transduction histidine kinase/ActR/RegA family two-component response regulator
VLALLDRVAGNAAQRDAQARRAARTIAASLLVGACAAAVLAVGYAALGSPIDALVGVTSSVGAVAILGLWRLSGRAAIATHGTLCYFVTVFCTAAHLAGSAAYLSWVAVVVLVAYYGGGLRLGAIWTVAATAALSLVGPHVGAPLDLGLGESSFAAGLVPTLRAVTLVPVIAILGAASELTRLAYVREIDLARQEAERANAARARLMAKVSHEIRTPLNGILGLTEATLLGDIPAAVRPDIEAVRASGKVLLSLVNDLLDVARAEAGRLEVVEEPLDIRALVDEVVALHRASAAQKGLRVDVRGSEPRRVLGDEVRLRQVVGNLLSNAIKFTPTGHVEVELETHPSETHPGQLGVRLSVTDTGPGMSEADRAQLFTPFFQVRSEDQHRGTGLGLAICHELVQRMGGSIEVESALGVGSSFRAHLSLAPAPAARRTSVPEPRRPDSQGPVASAPGTVPDAAPDTVRCTALVVDDNLVNLRVASALLGRLGVAVSAASSGAEALAQARERTFDLVLTDLQMPELDGVDTARGLRAGGFVGPIFALTASAEPTTADACLAAGLDGCLAKPVSLAALRAVVDAVRGGVPGAPTVPGPTTVPGVPGVERLVPGEPTNSPAAPRA